MVSSFGWPAQAYRSFSLRVPSSWQRLRSPLNVEGAPLNRREGLVPDLAR